MVDSELKNILNDPSEEAETQFMSGYHIIRVSVFMSVCLSLHRE